MNTTIHRLKSHTPAPTGFDYKIKAAIETEWDIKSKEIRDALAQYQILYHSAFYIRNVTWNAGTMKRNGITYHCVFYGGLKFADIKYAAPNDQFALSFRMPNPRYMATCHSLVPTVLIRKEY